MYLGGTRARFPPCKCAAALATVAAYHLVRRLLVDCAMSQFLQEEMYRWRGWNKTEMSPTALEFLGGVCVVCVWAHKFPVPPVLSTA